MRKVLDRVAELPPGLWIGLAFVLRLAFALTLKDRYYQIDEAGYTEPAWQWRTLHLLGTAGQASVAPPVVCGFIALFFAFGHKLIFPRLGQAILSGLTALMVGRITEDFSGSPRAGRLALVLASIYPFFVYYSAILTSETLYVGCVVAAAWATGWSLRDPSSRKTAALAGLCWALAALARSEAAPIGAGLWALGAALCLAGRWSWRSWALAVFCWTLPLFGWIARNKSVSGSWTLDTHGGITFLVGTKYYELDLRSTLLAIETLKQSETYRATEGLSAADRDKALFRAALRFMRENPGLTLRQWSRKFAGFWRFYPRTDKAYIESSTSNPGVGLGRWVLVAISLLFEPALILGGTAGLWALRHRPQAWLAAYFIAATTAVHVVVISMMRYRLPVMPFLIMGLAALCDRSLSPEGPGAPAEAGTGAPEG